MSNYLSTEGRRIRRQLMRNGDLLDTRLLDVVASPAGLASTDSALFAGLTPNTSYQLATGTYTINPTTLTTSGVRFVGAPGRRTILQLADQGGGTSPAMFGLSGSGITFEDIIFDGNKSTIAAGSNNYWSGLVQLSGGADDVVFRRCRFQNTARGAIYAIATGTRINRLVVDGCEFTGIANSGAGTGAASIMFDGGINGARIVGNHAYGQLPSNFLKVKEAELPSDSTTYTVQSGSTSTSIIANGTPWTASVHAGAATIRFITGALTGQARQVTANTTTTATTAAFTAAPAAGDTFRVYVKNEAGLCADNVLDYRANTAWDTTYGTLGIELFHGSQNWRCSRNHIYGPTATPTSGGYFWGISISDARGSIISDNEVIGSDGNLSAMGFGIEVAESPNLIMANNHIRSAAIGSNFTNNNYEPSHSLTIDGNLFENCLTYGIVSDSAPGGFKIANNTFVDCGKRFIFFNNTRVGGGNGTINKGLIGNCVFQLKAQTTLDGEGHIFGVYVASVNETDVADLTISDCQFGPHPQGTSTRSLLAINGNKPRGVYIHDCLFDGLAADGTTKSEGRPIVSNSGDWHVDHCTFKNYTGTAALMLVTGTVAHPLSTAEFNIDGGGNGSPQVRGGVVSSSTNTPISSTWWDPNGHLQRIEYQANSLWAPTAAAGANAGTSPPAPVVDTLSKDQCHRVTGGTGTGPAAGALIVVTFHQAFSNAPFVTVSPNNAATAGLGLYVSSRSTTGYTISAANAPTASQANTVYDVTAKVEAV